MLAGVVRPMEDAVYCTNCGATISEGTKFCPECGTPVEGTGGSNGDDLTRHVTDDIDFGAMTTNNEIPLTLGDISGGVGPAHTGTHYASANTGGTNPSSTYQTPGYQTGPIQQGTSNRGNGVLIGLVAALLVALIGAVVFFVLPSLEEKDPTTYRVSYETSGGTSIAAAQVEEGDTVTTPQDPARDGYLFKGWYLDSSHTESANFPYEVNEDTVFYAKWEEAPKEEEKAEEPKEEPREEPASITETPQQTQSSTGTVPTTTPQYNVTTLTCVGADGTTRSESIRRQPGTEFVLLDGNSRYYSEAEVAALSDAERCVAWNEIIAASNGYSFMNSGLRAYFANCSWYYEVPGASNGGNLTSAGAANVELLQAYTNSWWKNLATY